MILVLNLYLKLPFGKMHRGTVPLCMFDELFIERSAKSIWVHFAVRPEGNRRKVDFLKK